jgi:hypothetical protein
VEMEMEEEEEEEKEKKKKKKPMLMRSECFAVVYQTKKVSIIVRARVLP